jgi:hypothetical protein
MDNNCYEVTHSISNTDIVGSDIKFNISGSLSNDLIILFKNAANSNNLDWRYLAALSYAESEWNTTAKNDDGFYGIFQFKQKYMCTGKSIYSVKDQTDCAASMMRSNINFAEKKGMDKKNAFMYATIAHNTCAGAAQSLLDKASTKDVNGMLNAERYLPASELTWGSAEKRVEIVNHPLKCWKSYEDLCKKYPS